jgi:Domain of unknown function (DUF4167)
MIPVRSAIGGTAGWAGNARKIAAGQGIQSGSFRLGFELCACRAHFCGQGRTTVKRSRRGGRRPQHGGGGGGGSSNNGGGGGFNPNRTYDSSGPEIKIRGSASHVYEKYLQLARDANSGGDRIMAENYLQHAEHYYRIMAAAAAQQAQYQAQQAAMNPQGPHGQQPQGQPQPQPSQNGGSTPSFSLTETTAEEEDEEAEAS